MNSYLLILVLLGQTKPVYSDYPLNLQKIGVTLPAVSDPELQHVFKSDRTVFYKLPQVWQHYLPSSQIEHNDLTLNRKTYTSTNPVWSIYHARFRPDFNANSLFPWETTIGLNSAHKLGDHPYRTINFLYAPQEVRVIAERPIKWIYPSGTMVGEVVYVVQDGKRFVQEIRTRKKNASSTEWEVATYHPVKDRLHFVELTRMNYIPAYQYLFFRNPQEEEVFKMQGLVERLPPLHESEVKRLLALPFQKLDGDVWSPAADQDFHILPKGYCLNLLGSVDSYTCSNCHRQTQISVNNLTPKEPLIYNNPSKVGNIRGSDGVFTWHPFDPSCVRESDTDSAKPMKFREYDIKNHIIQYVEPTEPAGDYRLTQYVQEALKSYELPPRQYLHSNSQER